MKTSQSIAEVAAALKGAQQVLIVSHTSPDPDAYGSSCGLALALEGAGKSVTLLNESGVINRLDYIPGVKRTLAQLPQQQFDLVCVLDCGELKRVGDSLLETIKQLHPLVNIDHHISNDLFGDLNYVVTDASSTSELIFDLLRAAQINIPRDAATALYAGMLGDTGSFRYSNTSEKVFSTAAELVRLGAVPGAIAQEMYSRNSAASVRVQSEALAQMEMLAQGRCALIIVPEALAKKYGATKEDTEGLVERGRDIEGVLISVFIREEEGIWKISLRSKDARYNVSQLAAKFGGGGHVMAAAFRWKLPFDQLSAQLRKALLEILA